MSGGGGSAGAGAGNVRYWDDFQVGEVLEFGSKTVTAEEIVAFGREFDPQPFHVDEQAEGPFGGLIASGWHTAALFMRMYVDAVLSKTAGLGSPGIEDLRWLVPVRPGDELRGRVEVLEVLPSSKRDDRGSVRALMELLNQRGEVVLRMTGWGLFGRSL